MKVPRAWIETDETAAEMLTRVLSERPFLPLPPPLHKIPLRPGNVVEVVGPPCSAKTHILMQAAVTCILPKQFGGMERLAVFLDLDCRFDVARFSQLLNHKLKAQTSRCDEDLFAASMRRFLYIRCYNSAEFLATLKTMNYHLQKQKEAHGVGVHLLIIDSIGSFYWMDRALPSLCIGSNKRKNLSLQSVIENVVQDIQKLLLVHPILVLVSKTADSVAKNSSYEVTRNIKPSLHREYMPSIWQAFITHRLHVAALGPDSVQQVYDNRSNNQQCVYKTEWLLPPLKASVSFVVNNDGLILVS